MVMSALDYRKCMVEGRKRRRRTGTVRLRKERTSMEVDQAKEPRLCRYVESLKVDEGSL